MLSIPLRFDDLDLIKIFGFHFRVVPRLGHSPLFFCAFGVSVSLRPQSAFD